MKSCCSLAVQRNNEAGLPRESPDNPHMSPPDTGVCPHALLPAGVGRGCCSNVRNRLQENFPGLCSSLTPLMHFSLGEVLLLGMMNWEQQVLDERGGQGYLGWPRACSSSLKAGSGGPAGPGDVARSEQGLNPHTPGHGLTVVTQIPSPLSQPARYPRAGSRADR